AIRIPGSVPRTEWEPWRNRSFQTEFNIHPMPIGADIAMASDGSLAVGLKDRLGDMVPPGGSIGEGVVQSPLDPLIFGVALGDVLYAPRAADGWLPADPYHYFPFRPFWPRWPQGGMAAMGISDTIAMSSLDVDTEGGGNAIWHQRALWLTGTSTLPARQEYGCELSRQQLASPLGRRVIAAPQSRPAADNEIAFKMVSAPGDVELLCAPTVHPTPTLTKTPLISPTPSSTRTPSPTRTQTPTPTDTATETPTAPPSPTHEPAPIYLPITLTEPRCLPIHPKLDILLVLDASTSMRELTRAGRPKIDAAVAAARDFLTRLNLAPNGDRAGLVSFNAAATLDSPLTADRAALDAALGRVALAQFTRIDLGLDAAAAELAGPRRRADATAAVILLTDGRSNPVPVSEAERAAGVVKAAGARLFTIGLGQDVDAEALRAMASQAADYFEAPDGEDLGAIYGSISAALPCAPYSYWP
ncbi:MAG: vWA domain-containing protein, partial [Anaerolineae bacterium]